jgi:O-antigen ligase
MSNSWSVLTDTGLRNPAADGLHRSKTIISHLFGHILSFETSFVLFMFAGIYKADPRFSWIPVDLTMAFMTINIIVGMGILMRRKFMVGRGALFLVLLYLLFVAYAISSLWWTPGSGYSTSKTISISIIIPWTIAASALIISPDPQRLRRLLIMLFLFSFWIAIEGHIGYLHTKKDWSVTVMNGSYLGVGRVVGIGALILLGYVLFYRSHMLIKLAGLCVFGYFIYILLIMGGRGPLLATLLGMLLPLLFSVRFIANTIKLRGYMFVVLSILIVCGVVITYLILSQETTQTINRMLLLFGNNHDLGNSGNTRAMYYEDSIGFWQQSPIFGHGIGSFPTMYGYPTSYRLYPHNLFLEVLVELGLVGLGLLVMFFVAGVRYIFPLGRFQIHLHNLIPLMLLANTFFNAQVTGDLNDNRFFFCTLALLPLLRIPEREGELRI